MRLPALLKILLLGITLIAAPALAEDAVPLDANGRVPVGFKGDDAEKIYNALAKLPELKKDQFESQADYAARIDKIKDTIALPGGKTLGSRMAFVIDRGHYPPDEYNSEKKQMAASAALNYKSIRVPDEVSWNKAARWLNGFIVQERTRKIGSYTGTNAFGAKTQVTKEQIDSVWLGFYGKDFRDRAGLGMSIAPLGDEGELFEIDSSRAKGAVGNINLLVVCKIANPYIIAISEHDNPTISRPRDITTHLRSVFVDINEVWIYNAKNGEVYKKIIALDEAKK
ncbi:MAG: hypothetical protein AB1400_01570 [Pseudomonadota bacterium]